jgi:hypothetical protein
MSRDDGNGLEAERTVPEGGTIDVSVRNGASSVRVYVGNGRTGTDHSVKDGKVSIPVPPGAANGTLITIMTLDVPPAAVTVEVVSQEE